MRRFIWTVSAGTCLCWKQWGDGFIIFHEASGNTHYLNLFAATALKLLFDKASCAESLAKDTSDKLSIPYEPSMVDSINVMLSELKSLGVTKATAT
jgi:PqqD family protein of HPr-rel-A system